MKNVKLDRIDRIILRELQENGRITNVELAQKAGISPPPCLRRTRALEEAGYIRGYHADIVPEKMEYNLTVFIQVTLSHHAEKDLDNFAKLLQSWPQVRFCYMLAGDPDFLIKVVSKNWPAFQEFLTKQLVAAPNVDQIKSLPTVRRTHYNAGVPIEEDL